MRAICIARHPMLSQHLAMLCASAGSESHAAVGVADGFRLAGAAPPDVVLCEVDLLTPDVLDEWAQSAVLGRVPLLAVSLTRRQDETPFLSGTPVAGYLYLPGLSTRDLARLLAAATGRGATAPAGAYHWRDVEPTPAA